MDDEDRLRRIDENLELSRDYMREGHELMAQLGETMERNRVAFEDLRTYLQQATTILGALVADMRAAGRERESWRDESRAWRRETREWHRALGAKVDRLRDEPPPAAA
jgi:hypothetical protein